MDKNDYEQQPAAMSAAELRDCLLLIIREFNEPCDYEYDDLLRVHKGVLEVLNDWDLNPDLNPETEK